MKLLHEQYNVLTEKELLKLNGGYSGSSGGGHSCYGRGSVSYGYSGHSGGSSSGRTSSCGTYKRYSFGR